MKKPKVAHARCEHCGETFVPNPRAVCAEDGERRVTQKACRRVKCQRARKAKAAAVWRRDNEGWKEKQRGWMRSWSDQHPDRWREFRAENPGYRRRERERMRRKRAERVAKVDAIRHDPVGYLRGIRSLALGSVAKVDGIAAGLDGVVDYLEVRAGVAQVDGIGRGRGAA
mgnify:CR=1 FL=1